MQSIYFVDSNFTYESSKKSILSIRYATDGFSFCVHDETEKLVVFVHEPYAADSREAAVARLKNYVVNDEIFNLRFKKVYIMHVSRKNCWFQEPFSTRPISPPSTRSTKKYHRMTRSSTTT